jgi:hypothetical protein
VHGRRVHALHLIGHCSLKRTASLCNAFSPNPRLDSEALLSEWRTLEPAQSPSQLQVPYAGAVGGGDGGGFGGGEGASIGNDLADFRIPKAHPPCLKVKKTTHVPLREGSSSISTYTRRRFHQHLYSH